MNNIFENWTETKEVLLDGLSTDQKVLVGQVLENQKDQVLKESAAAGSVQAHDVAGFRNILIPMIRRIIPGTIATQLVGVQAMKAPVAQIFSLRYRYADAMSTGGAGTDIVAGDELFGNDKLIERFYSGGTDLAQPAGAGGFGHSGVDTTSEPVDINGIATGDGWESALDAASGCNVGGSGSYIEGTGGRAVSLEVINQTVETKTRKLQASWTLEAMQDMSNQHNMNMETELTKAMSADIVQEIDNEIIADLFALAGTVQTYDYAALPAGLTPTFLGDKYANLGPLINYVANEIGRKTRRGAANFIVVSPMVLSVLQSAAKAVFSPAIEGSFSGPNNSHLAGVLNGTIKVYSHLWNGAQPGNPTTDNILVGYKGGNGETDTGFFYCPYIPLMSTGTIMNPVTTQPSISLMTRYGKATFTDSNVSLGNSSDYYGKIIVNNIQFA